MFIVFEGPDGSGKSTLAEAVQKKLNATRVHCGPPHPSNALEQWMSVVTMASGDFNVVVDRLHWGDPVYAPIYRKEVGEQLGVLGFHTINKAIADIGGIIVHVTANIDALTARFDGEYIKTTDLFDICEAYEVCELLSVGVVPVFHIDTSEGFEHFDEWVDLIIDTATTAWDNVS